MSGVIRRRDSARHDLITIYRRLVYEAGVGAADRFLVAAEETFERLAAMPGVGARYAAEHPLLGELRVVSVAPRFKLYLVFYRITDDGIEIVRILHGARDIPRLLNTELGVEDGDAEP